MTSLRSFLAIALASGAIAAQQPTVLVADGGWCWFQDERAVVIDDRWVVFGSVADGRGDPERAGDVEATRWDLRNGTIETFELADRLDRDDHAAPAFFLHPDGKLFCAYCSHGHDDVMRWRVGRPKKSPFSFGRENSFRVPMKNGNGVTYSNLFMTSRGGHPCVPEAIVNICRAEDWDPTVVASFDDGFTWEVDHRPVSGPGRPYAKYAGDDRVVHFVCSDQHPRDADNGLWYGYFMATFPPSPVSYRDRPDFDDDHDFFTGPQPHQLSRVFEGRVDAVAWPCDLALDAEGMPHCVFSVQVDGAFKPKGEGGQDHRYWYGRHDGKQWRTHEIAFAGTKLYAGEDDYTGLCCLVPDNPSVVFISTNADPVTNAPLISEADGRRHWEIFMGRTTDGGKTWTWRAVTKDSTVDNLRPIVPRWRKDRCVLLWLRGEYRSYTDYDQQVVGQVMELSR